MTFKFVVPIQFLWLHRETLFQGAFLTLRIFCSTTLKEVELGHGKDVKSGSRFSPLSAPSLFATQPLIIGN